MKKKIGLSPKDPENVAKSKNIISAFDTQGSQYSENKIMKGGVGVCEVKIEYSF